MSARLDFGPVSGPGSYDLTYRVVLPENCRLVQKNPETVQTVLKKN